MSGKRHSPEEIATKLRRAAEMAKDGRHATEITRALGISMMTYHRWRTAAAQSAGEGPAYSRSDGEDPKASVNLDRIGELRLENARLRRLVTDLLLEKVSIEERIQVCDAKKKNPT